ncbi:L,D-transpeptidase [Alicyclobacillus fastidiosus]|uniref:L,D-transpeptidase n=1 Tax=Alicyclobacillus fastidiosus TaxID=392011 RepID=A0ABY6ZPH5_9BACL|nr:L,D-transpeptidase [Alicyclobacillus fastidiosus]WAH44746.1 L,D-transpeptidase [Alicyclobacillus fastidiosus]
MPVYTKCCLRWFTLVLACCFALTGCSPTKRQPTPQLEYDGVVTSNAAKGVEISFNHPVASVTWVWNGKTHQTLVRKPSNKVWIPASLPQGTAYHIVLRRAQGPGTNPWTKTAAVDGETAPPLTVTTNPGIWQFNVPADGPFTFTFSAPIANQAQLLQDLHFSPPVAGQLDWTSDTTAQFIPAKALSQAETVHMTIDGGIAGPMSTRGQYLANATIERPFIVASDERIVVTETLPERLTLYRNGKPILTSLCNTGVTGAATQPGQYYIHSMVPSATMSGVDPDGETYHIPNVPWVMDLVGNTAIHGYPRASYGYPQSNGCVELPIETAEKLYQLVQIGTSVVIEK